MNIIWTPTRNYNKGKDKKNQLLVIHWIAGRARDCVNFFQSAYAGRSAHYVIGCDGAIVQMVAEQDIAWHAGISRYKDFPTKDPVFGEWDSLNPCSIGIELEGPPSCVNLDEWPDKELISLIELCKDIASRNPGIKLIDHSSISPGKIDVKKAGHPQDVFPWSMLLQQTGIPEA